MNKINKHISSAFKPITTAALAALMLAGTRKATQAQISNPAAGRFGEALDSSCDAAPVFVDYFILVWNAVISIGAIVVIVMFLWGAVEWITSDNDSGKLSKARGRMFNAAIGMLLLIASFAIISFVSNLFFGKEFDLLNFSLPTGLECGGS